MSDFDAKLRRLVDVDEIKRLKYDYCRFNDGGWPDQPVSHRGPSHELFTEDGIWDGRPVAGYAEGREAIRKLFDAFAVLPLAYHAVMNPVIEVDGDRATGHWHLIACGEAVKGESSLTIGGYEDVYVRTPAGWRIKSMRCVWGRRMVAPADWGQMMEHILPKVAEGT
jgi:hypothetical protein